LSKTDEVSYQEGVRNFDFDKNLAFYFNEQLGQNYKNWLSLSNYINHDLITKF